MMRSKQLFNGVLCVFAALGSLMAARPAAVLGATGAPMIQSATLVDVNNDGTVSLGDQIVLTLTRSVTVTTMVLQADHFFLPVESDAIGGSGFQVHVNQYNGRQILLQLGANVRLQPFGEFTTAVVAVGSPSGIDFASTLPVGSIMSLDGLPAVDRGAAGANDTGIDIRQSLFGLITNLDAAGGMVPVNDFPDAAYTGHALVVPAGALGNLVTFQMKPPPITEGVVNAFWIESSSPTLTFAQPATVRVEFHEGDIDFERGQVTAQMRVHQLVEIPGLGFQYLPLPGVHHVMPAPRTAIGRKDAKAGGEGPQKLDSDGVSSGTVETEVGDLNPGGSVGPPGMFAGIPIETVDERTIHIKPGAGGVIKQANAILTPGPDGAYTLHAIEFPGYVETTSTDSLRLTVTIRTALQSERVSSSGGQSFPAQSGAVFVIVAKNASDQPVQFTDPVNLTVQFKTHSNPSLTDTVRFDGDLGMPGSMRAVADGEDGPGVDFAFFFAFAQSVNVAQGTVTVQSLTGLTGVDGKGTFGAVIPDPADIRRWQAY